LTDVLSFEAFMRLEAVSGTVSCSTSPQLQQWLFVGTASKLISFPDHFLPNCFRFSCVHRV